MVTHAALNIGVQLLEPLPSFGEVELLGHVVILGLTPRLCFLSDLHRLYFLQQCAQVLVSHP